MARRAMAAAVVVLLLLGTVPLAAAQEAPVADVGLTPPRLSYVEGPVSFWRPGADDWAPAQLNTPLAPGDELYTSHEGNVELQVGPRAFVRGWGDTQLGLANHEAAHLQVKLTAGHLAVDLRDVEPGRAVEVDTPHAAFTIDSPGYYRADVTAERTSFVARRAGRATVTAADVAPIVVGPEEAVMVEGTPVPSVQRVAAPAHDVWDRWNEARTASLLGTTSARYVPADIYGTSELDRYGAWRTVPTYGSVWVPAAVPVGWAPYTTGRWIWDPFYGWTWVDTAPWGWAPYHYGRWVFIDSYWAWAPGPIVRRAVYAPALVVFFGTPSVTVSIGAPLVSWCALGWGEPVVPWWGRPGFIGRPWWGGWGGPRHTTVVNVTNITVYRNARVRNAVVAVEADRFGRRAVHEARVRQVDVRRLTPVRGDLGLRPAPASFVAAGGRAQRPAEATLARPVVATRPLPRREPTPAASGTNGGTRVERPPARIVPAPAREPRDARPVRREPELRPAPDVRRQPELRPAPDVRRQPEARPTPDVRRQPEGRPAPDARRQPERRPTPDVRREPEGRPAPDVRRQPNARPTPDVRREPEVPPAPDVRRPPEVRPTPDVRREPQVRPAPDVRRPPEVRPTPDVPRQPEVRSTPELRRQPEVRPEGRREPEIRREPDVPRPGEPRREPDVRPRSDARPESPGRQEIVKPAAPTPRAEPTERVQPARPRIEPASRPAERVQAPAQPQAAPAAQRPQPARPQAAPVVQRPQPVPAPPQAAPTMQRPQPGPAARPQAASPAANRGGPSRSDDQDARTGPRG